ncbi:MAG TPA: nidogen-like domain-containing protein, partial [Bacteroidia bacterium]|nr:nidogen-like domain-containing protein [Bacteroidia bacterium]
MKKILLFAGLCTFVFANAQQSVTLQQYDQLKASGQLDPHQRYTIIPSHHNAPAVNTARYSGPSNAQNISCNCMIPLDTTFQVVPFVAGTGPDYRNDDGSSPVINLPFSFNFFGTMMDSLFINNNGNISFGAPYSTFTSSGFPNANFITIAPFWADVDTRDAASGLVYYQLTPTHLIVKWDSVGYYAMHSNFTNSFQLIITDGSDTLLPAGTNVSFCYDDMQWTTGDASGGVNGFGGSPSTAGVNLGNGVDYFQVTQNDQAGNLFDGPYGNNDGVDWLDNMQVLFNTSINGNVPPLVMNNTICDTIDVYTGDTLRTIAVDSISFEMYFMTPEPTQVVTD